MVLEDDLIAELLTIFPDHDFQIITNCINAILGANQPPQQVDRHVLISLCTDRLLGSPEVQVIAPEPNEVPKKRKLDTRNNQMEEALPEPGLPEASQDDLTDPASSATDSISSGSTAVSVASISTSASVASQHSTSTSCSRNTSLAYPVIDPNKLLQADELEPYLQYVIDMFPSVDDTWLRQRFLGGYTLAAVIEYIVTNINSVPKLSKVKKMKKAEKSTDDGSADGKTKDFVSINYFIHYDPTVCRSAQYTKSAHDLLMDEFRSIRSTSLDSVLRFCSFRYAPAVKIIRDTLFENRPNGGCSVIVKKYPPIELPGFTHGAQLTLTVNMTIRPKKRQVPFIPDDLKAEIEWLNNHLDDSWISDQPSATSSACSAASLLTSPAENAEMQILLQEARDRGDAYECAICCDEYVISDMLPCTEGHLFCRDCLRNHAKEIVYGQAKAQIMCLEADCKESFSMAVLEKALDSEWLEKLDERHREENINCADIQNLIRCKSCNFAVVDDTPVEENKVFKCPNPECEKAVCRLCDVDWEEHVGLRCEEIESKDETSLRTKMEEKMAEAVIRCCYACKAKMIKIDGCNKMTCRCGAKMCYICRAPGIDYNHFCNHLRSPGKNCSTCVACSLWENAAVKDNRTIEEIEHEAKTAQQAAGFKVAPIGAPPSVTSNLPPAPAIVLPAVVMMQP